MLLPYPIPFLRSWGDHCLRHPGQSQPQISNLRKVLWPDFELAPGSFVLDSRVKRHVFLVLDYLVVGFNFYKGMALM